MSTYQHIRIAGGDTSQPLCLTKRLKLLSRLCDLSRTRLLDCGCGAGEYVFALMEQYGADAWGIEYQGDKVAKANCHARHGHRVSQGDIGQLPYAEAEFDLVLLNEVLEHVPDECMALREVFRVLKRGGLLFVFSPNRWFPFETHGCALKRRNQPVPPSVPFIPWLPRSIAKRWFVFWARNYGQGELTGLIRNAGFEIRGRDYVWQTFEGISGQQPSFIRATRRLLRRVSNLCESLPFVRRFGVSQVVVASKPDHSPHAPE